MNKYKGIEISFDIFVDVEGKIKDFKLRFLSEIISNAMHSEKTTCTIKMETNPVISICSEYAHIKENINKINRNIYFIIG
jgi:hypothetical protein